MRSLAHTSCNFGSDQDGRVGVFYVFLQQKLVTDYFRMLTVLISIYQTHFLEVFIPEFAVILILVEFQRVCTLLCDAVLPWFALPLLW